MRIAFWLGCTVAACALAGCGSGNGLTMGRVYGVVTYNGQPVEFGEVLYLPDTEKGNSGVPSMGPITKDGSYVMSTQDEGDGVIAGYHKVGIRALDAVPVGDESAAVEAAAASSKNAFAGRMKNAKGQSPAIRKNRAKKDAPTVSFRGRVHRFLAPEKLANPQTSGIAVQISRGSNRVNFDIAEDGSVKVTQ
jgi:hypothetical protein